MRLTRNQLYSLTGTGSSNLPLSAIKAKDTLLGVFCFYAWMRGDKNSREKGVRLEAKGGREHVQREDFKKKFVDKRLNMD